MQALEGMGSLLKQTGAMNLVGMTAAGLMIGEGGPTTDNMIPGTEVTTMADMATERQGTVAHTMTTGLAGMPATEQHHAIMSPGTVGTIGRATATAMRTGLRADTGTRSG